MQYNTLENMGKAVSRFGMGCMRLPGMKDENGKEIIDEAESIKMIQHAIENNVNFFDTAYAYAGSEELLGKALAGGYREKVVISTKCPMYMINDHDDYYKIFDEQLKRLQTGYVDVYLFHCMDRPGWEKVKATNGLGFMQKYKEKGLIKQIGFSFHCDYELFEEIIEYFKWDICLIQLNILDTDHQAGLRGLKYAADKGLDVMIMEPLKGGLLGSEPPEEIKKLLDAYSEKRPLVEWAFRWLYHHKEAKVILSGVSSMEQLNDNLRIFSDSAPDVLSAKDMELISRIKDIYYSKVKVGCTHCGYCMPCAEGVNIPEIFKVYNDSSLSSWTEFGKVFYSLVATSVGRDASKCIKCKKCEKRCPQNIHIVDMLMEAHALMA